MKYSDLISKTESELVDTAYNIKKSVYALRVQKKLNQLNNTASIRTNRRDLARVLMRLSELKNQKV